MIDDYTPGFRDYLNNIKEKNPTVDRDYTIADFAIQYAIGCAHAEYDGALRMTEEQLMTYVAICCGAGALLDETLWLEGKR